MLKPGRRETVFATLAALVAGAASFPARAQTYPSRPVKIIFGFSAGGISDSMVRVVADHLARRIGQQVLVENRVGANGILGSDAVAKASPDGYTLLFGVPGPMVVLPAMGAKLPYDPIKDFEPVALVGVASYAIVVPASLPVRNLNELLALARAKPRELNYAHAGKGTTTHISMEILKTAAGVDIVGVPYKGQAAAMPDLISGRVQVMIDGWSTTMPHVKTGALRYIAVTTASRSMLRPEVPTIAESGFPGFDLSPWYGIWAPAGTPRDIVDKLSAELNAITKSPEIKERFAELGMDPLSADATQFRAFMQSEQPRWTKAIKDARLTLE